MVYQRFSKRQRITLLWWNNSLFRDKDGIICDGSIRSGKTISMAVGFIFWSMSRFDGQSFAICGKTIESLRRNVITQLPTWLEGLFTVTERRSENKLIVSAGGKVNTYYLFGGRDESSYALIQGITLAGVLFDEVALMPRSFVEQALARCSIRGSKFWFNCNPESPSHWFYKEWVSHPKRHNMLYIHFTMADNLSLAPEIKQRYETMYTGIFRRRYILGEWVNAEGVVYPQFVESPDSFVIDTPPPIRYAIIGVDFGGSKSAHSFTLTGFTNGFHEVVVLDEFYHANKEKRLSPSQVETAFVDFVRRAKQKYNVSVAYCDSAEQTLIEGLTVTAARERIGIEVANAQKREINERIAFYNSIMAQGRFKIMRHCKNTIDALSTAIYDDKSKAKDVRLDNGTTNIDSLDSLEYTTERLQADIMYISLQGR